MERWVIGVDEAGRGPIAGPVSVGVVMVPEGFDVLKEFSGVRDSKLLTLHKREEIFELALRREQAGDIRLCVRLASHEYIDAFGITKAVRRGVWSGVRALSKPGGVRVVLDGLLKAPPAYAQQTIVGGDLTEPVISLASVLAKVKRDRLMIRMAKRYPEYGFERHKGYGTRAHWAAVTEHGLCDLHRRTYCKMSPFDTSPREEVGLTSGRVW